LYFRHTKAKWCTVGEKYSLVTGCKILIRKKLSIRALKQTPVAYHPYHDCCTNVIEIPHFPKELAATKESHIENGNGHTDIT